MKKWILIMIIWALGILIGLPFYFGASYLGSYYGERKARFDWSTWTQKYDNEKYKLGDKKGRFSLRCCDCGLVHRGIITIENNEPYISMTRDDVTTDQYRKDHSIKIVKGVAQK